MQLEQQAQEAVRHGSKRAREDEEDDFDEPDEDGSQLGIDPEAVENVGVVATLQDGQLPVVPGFELDDNDEFGDTVSHARSAAGDDVFDDANEIQGEEVDEIAAVPLERWHLGEGFAAIPPSDSRSAVNSDWTAWSQERQGKLRAVRHLIMQRSLETRDTDTAYFSFKGYSDPEKNERVAALAALEGLLMDTEAKGIYVDGQGLLQQRDLPEDEDKRKQAIRSMDPIDAYLYTHSCRMEYDDEGNAVPGAPEYAPEDPVPGTKLFTRTAPCSAFAVETLYMKKKRGEGDLPEDHSDYESRGPQVGTRIHKFIFNRRYSSTAYVAESMKENNITKRAGRASRMENKFRAKNVGPEKAAKQQRAMVNNPDVNQTAGMKSARIEHNYSLVHNYNAAAGVGTGGKTRNVYPDMQKALGSASMNRTMEPHPTLGSLHALSPEWALNARDGANPPANIFPEDQYPDLERNPDPDNVLGRAYVTFMTSMDGLAFEIDPKQTNPNNYMDGDGCIVFPYPDSVQWNCNSLLPLRDATLPLVLSLGAPIGDNALDAFWTVNSKTDAILEAEQSAVHDAVTRNMLANSLDVEDLSLFEEETERMKSAGRPNFADMKTRLAQLFDAKMRPDQESVTVKRLKASRMVMKDSLDPTPAEMSTGSGGYNEAEITTRRVTLATEETAKAIRSVSQMIDEAYAIKLSNAITPSQKKRAEDWYPTAKRESIDWGLRLMKSVYENPKYMNAVYPVARNIWNSTFKAISKLPSVFKHAKVDETDPRRKNGSINIAFGFNRTQMYSGLSAYGNYTRLLSKVYSKVLGIQGRVLAGRWALHYASFAPVGPPGFKPMLMRNGRQGLNKTGECVAFQYLFNGSWCTDIETNWWQMTGEGSAQSLRAGGISGTSGGVAWSDEALRSISTGGVTTDAQATEKMQDMKILCTQGFLSRPRTYKVSSPSGPGGTLVESFRTINDVTLDSTQRVMACNTGCNAAYLPAKGPPPRPDADRRALIDRCVSVPATEGAVGPCRTDAEFKSTVKNEVELVWTHAIMTRLTYILLDCVCLVPEWQASNEKAAMDAWSLLDTYMNHKFDIPIPEPRRQTQRRTTAIIKSIERALASYMMVKEETVAFPEMLPISSPFSQSDDPDKCVHVLAPFDIGNLVNVISTLVYDTEVILDTFSMSFDSNLWTTNELHHILVQMSMRHGLKQPTGMYMEMGLTETSRAPRDAITMQPRPRTDQASTSCRQYGSSGGYDAGTYEEAQSDTQPEPQSDKELPQIKFLESGKGAVASTQPVLNTCQRFFERRREILMEFMRKAQTKTVCAPGNYEKNKVSGKVESVMCTHTENREGQVVKCCRLEDGSVELLSKVQDMMLITCEEVISCGYSTLDVGAWVRGEESKTSFSAHEGENIFLGVKTTTWQFKRRNDVERSTEHVYDPAWRSTGIAPTVSGTVVASPVSGSGDAASSHAPQPVQGHLVTSNSRSSGGSSESRGDTHVWIEAQAISKSLSQFNLDSAQVFDRIVQILDCTKDNFRRIQLSPDLRRETICVKELDSADSTTMRRRPEGCPSTRNMDDSNVAQAIGSDSILKCGVSGQQKVMPFSAMSFGNTYSDLMHKSRRVREWITLPSGEESTVRVLKPEDLSQRRLDTLIDVQALPAAVPLMSTKIAIDCPLKVFGDAMYINSGFAMNVMRLQYEIVQFFKTVPGLRLQSVGEANSSGKDVSGDDSSSGKGSESCESVPAEASSSTAPPPNTDGKKISEFITKRAEFLVDNGSTTFTALDVHDCINNLKYESSNASMMLFDMVPLFYTLKLHELFNYLDPLMCKYLTSKFPLVFPNTDCIEGLLPDTVTRFYENENENVVDKELKFNVALSSKLLTTVKRFEKVASFSAKRARRDFTYQELAKIRATHRENTGEDIKDISRLQEIAEKQCSKRGASSSSICDRAEWRENAVDCKIKCGMIHPRGALKNVVADIGLGLFNRVRSYYAQRPAEECPDKTMRKGIEYLRPYKAPCSKGTCAEKEWDTVEISLQTAINDVIRLRSGSTSSEDSPGQQSQQNDEPSEQDVGDLFDHDDEHACA